ncbi:MAG: methylmalonyl-CoA/ethylmalonyl-CoA epimerase [Mycobacterium sp.]|jgi:4-hydroxyphenylpyruvate dioxygenase-like putative hemolysin|nr:methylmalonyl-CoA/ethylmalonyl-CoA epimerase [Mycobacterium sp.]MDT5090495.1 methylmalonyl-CoA/ethylmalonyl-CoA epimerase [Mycobacterium sp.]MDT5206211.1 methylmalonyl-CoA/ethylmalonyl-CoA epimerase [Mycobacterium sp.]MDT5228304.1 methylmalonyl-CoA/ethylmalonyl-CoA epimerase [Mycobacterium sp.]
MPETQLHHVVFAVAPERQASVAQMFTELGFRFESTELTELGLTIHLDWNGGVELISAVPGATAEVAASVSEFVKHNGDGVYTVVLRVPGASDAEAVTERYGSTTRFRQSFSGEGSYLEEIDLAVFGLPLTLLSTNVV